MAEIELLYDRTTLKTSIPDSAKISMLGTNPIVELEDPHEKFLDAIDNPVSGPSLPKLVTDIEPKNVLLICSDHTRVDRKDIVLPWILDALNSLGISDGQVKILIALGTHDCPSAEKIPGFIGAAFDRVQVIPHDQEGDFIDLGKTPAGTHLQVNALIDKVDLIITYSATVHHYFAGYGGARKMILPGISSLETIRQNHSLLWDSDEDDAGRNPRAIAGILDGNPISDDMVDAAKIALSGRNHFSISSVLSPDKKPCCFIAGDIINSHRMACLAADNAYMVELDRYADLVIASAGGFPKDIDIIQGHKGMDNAVRALKPGGTLIYLMACSNGHGNPAVAEFAPLSLKEAKRRLIEKYIINGQTVYAAKCKARDYRVIMVSMLTDEDYRNLGITRAENLEHAISMVDESVWKSGLTYVIPRADLVVPKVI